MSYDAIPNNEDSLITKTVAELCQNLRLNFNPSNVTWMGNLDFSRSLSSDQVVFIDRGPKRGRVILPSALRGRLETEDWKPLITSGLIFQMMPESRRIWRGVGQALRGFLIAGIMSGPLLAVILPQGFAIIPRDTLTSLYVACLFLFLFFLALSRFTFRFFNLHVVKRLRLEADRKAAQVIGKERFLNTLKKIDAMRIEDLEDGKVAKRSIWRGRVSIWPSLTERIKNLE